jgi:hypothetical protein
MAKTTTSSKNSRQKKTVEGESISQKKTLPFERKLNNDGSVNSKYVDLLEEDKPIAGQKFVCVSFVSPEKILKQKEFFFFEEFLKKWEINKSMEKFAQFLNFLSFKYNLSFDDIMKDFEEFVKEEKVALTKYTIDDDYKTFLDKNEDDLEKSFGIKYNFQTATRGLKVRGVYPSMEEAELRCKMLREVDPNHDVFVGPVGMWMPWDPEAYKTGRVEYMEEELNKLMSEKVKNETNAKTAFEQRLKETKQKAIEENMKNAEKSGNVLTQTIDEQCNLVGIANMNTQESTLVEKGEISVSDIRSELFESENVVIGKSDNGQSLLVSGPFANNKM